MMLTRNFISLLSFAFVLAITSCGHKVEIVSKEEALQFAKEIETSVNKGDEDFLNNIFDEVALSDKINANLKNSKKVTAKETHAGLLAAGLGKQIIDNIEKDGSYELVRVYEKNNIQHLLFRLFGGGAVNYHDYELGKRHGEIKANDMFIYLSGNNMSDLMASGIGSFDGLQNSETDRQLAAMQKIKELMTQGKFKEAKEEFDAIPASLKNLNVFQGVYIQICKGISDTAYTEALAHYSKLYPNAPNTSLLNIDASILHKNYPETLVAMNKLDSIVGGDPFQDYYRGLIYKLMFKQDSSLKYFEALHRHMPSFAPADPELLEIYLDKKENEKARSIYFDYKKNKKADKAYLENVFILHPDFKKIVEPN